MKRSIVLLGTVGALVLAVVARIGAGAGEAEERKGTEKGAGGEGIEVCAKLQTKREPEGLHEKAIKFEAPAGNGRHGANGFLFSGLAQWERRGTAWQMNYNGPQNCFGVQFIHPFNQGQVVVRVLTYPLRGSKITINSSAPWREGGWQGKSDVAVKEHFPMKDVEKLLMGDKPVPIVSTLGWDGAYHLLINGKVVAEAQIKDARPLDLSNREGAKIPYGSDSGGRVFVGDKLPEVLKKGQAGVIVAPTDRGTGIASDIMLRYAGGKWMGKDGGSGRGDGD